MRKLRELTLIGAIMAVGVLAGLYVHASGSQYIISVSDWGLKTPEERVALENQAIDLALSDSRVSKLANVTGVRILSTFYTNFSLVFNKNDTLSPGASYITTTWDGKYRALVTIQYKDDTGYGVDVNITDKVVGAPVKAVWEDGGKVFKLLLPL